MDARDNKASALEESFRGKYYSLASELWSVEPKEYAGGYRKIQKWRERVNPNSHYRVLLSEIGLAKQQHNTNSKESSERLSSKLLNSRKLPGQLEKIDPFGLNGGEDAHQLPDSVNCAPTYGPAVQPVLGVDIESLIADELNAVVDAVDRIQRVSKSIQEEESKSPSLNENLKKKYVKKVLKYLANDAKFAVKNLIINKVRMPGPHKVYYDTHPSLVTIPVLPLDGIRNWTPGTVYPIIIIASSEETYAQAISSKAIVFGGEKCNVELASSTELAEATELLRDMVKALAELASDSRQGAVVSPIDMAKKDSKEEKKLKELRDSLGNGLVEVPTHLPGVKGRVLKLSLQVNTGYEIADPMLVLMKAAINWYYMFTGKKLLPACGPPVDPEKAEIEALNVELHEQIMEERYNEEIRPQSWEGLAKGLGQWAPNTPEQGTSVPRVSLSPHETNMDVAK